MLRRVSFAGLCGVACFVSSSAAALQTPDQQTATFRAGTRLVQVEVVVRGKRVGFTAGHPVTGLTKDDFTILDQGKPQRIDVFHAGPASADLPAAPLPPGTVSNRVNRLGEALPNATAVLFDPLNTRFDLKAYARKGVLELIRGLGPRDRAAIYALGRNLHVLQDFTDDPAKLLAALSHLDSGRDLMPANVADALFDFPTDMTGAIEGLSPRVADAATRAMYKRSIEDLAETNAGVNAAVNGSITIEALRRIVQHLSGMPGRRNLVWLMDSPFIPPPVLGMLLQADIHLYPVLVRTVDPGDPYFLFKQRDGRDLAAMTGGASFDDALDLKLALQTAEEDSQSAYTLGYYPSEDALDGRYHRLTVTVAAEKSVHFEIRYRPGYIATKQEVARAAPPLADAIAGLAANPLDATAIGITAQARPDTLPGLYQVRVTLDLHDVYLKREGNRSVGKVEVIFPLGDNARVRAMDIDLTDDQLAEVFDKGFVTVTSGIKAAGDAIRVIVRDPFTGVAGSLKIPLR
jgi:VWFA-related protein